MTVENEVAALTTSVDALTSAVNVRRSSLDASVSSASTSASLAATHKNTANTLKGETISIRDAAVTAASSADTDAASAYQDLTAIAESKSETATDVFVYDTSKDSDGGAWRNRTQGTSWYNEALNTSVRGANKKFPAVAVLVLETSRLTIYDADDPSMPMWMVFTTGSNSDTGETLYKMMVTGNLNAVTMKNGMLCVARSSFVAVDFIGDRGLYAHNGYQGHFSGHNVSQRNEFGKINNNASNWLFTTGSLVVPDYNAVTTKILPDAPLDPVTGLPVQTIAIGADNGVSIIKDNGKAVRITGQHQPIDKVAFTKDNKIACHYNFTSELALYEIAESDQIFTDRLVEYFPYTNASAPDYPRVFTGSFRGLKQAKEDFVIAAGAGLCNVSGLGADRDDTMVNYINTFFNTGWMNGDIKLATLMDTTAETVSPSELVASTTQSGTITNTSASTGNEWFTVENLSQVSISSNTLTFNNSSWESVRRNVGMVLNKTYRLSFDLSVTQGNLQVYQNGSTNVGSFSTSGSHSVNLLCDGSVHNLQLSSSNLVGTISNISVTEVVPDRSVNDNSLNIVGNIVKQAVAIGAELVGYTGFTTSSWLELPDSTGLDFGGNDFSVSVWARTSGDTYFTVVDNMGTSSVGWALVTTALNSSTKLRLRIGSGTFESGEVPELMSGSWTAITVVRKGLDVLFYVNGKLRDIASSASVIYQASPASNTNTRVGVRLDAQQTLSGNMSLLRISATAPTAEQIAKIYRDEKPLFQEGAKCTLYGNSNNVVAMDYDDATDTIHAGTSSQYGSGGLSEFSGLRRTGLNSNTTSVGYAVSAQGGLVVSE
jgi:hypothetical protein